MIEVELVERVIVPVSVALCRTERAAAIPPSSDPPSVQVAGFIEALTDEQFGNHVQALSTKLLEKPKRMYGNFDIILTLFWFFGFGTVSTALHHITGAS